MPAYVVDGIIGVIHVRAGPIQENRKKQVTLSYLKNFGLG
jgi:hypothetical protein